MDDRKLGYIIIFLLLSTLMGTTLFLAWRSFLPLENRTIIFKEVGSLNVEDPVRLRGLVVAHVKSISKIDTDVAVEIESLKPLDIHEDYRIEVAVKGVMGDRFISILPGDVSKPLVNKNTRLIGSFATGPSEALAYMYKLKATVTYLKDLSFQLKDGTAKKQSLIRQFATVTVHLDSLTISMLKISQQLDKQIGAGVDTLETVLAETVTLTAALSKTTPEFINSMEILLNNLHKIITQVETLTNQSQKFVADVNKPDNIIWSSYVSDLQKQLKVIQVIIKDIQVDGLKLPVMPR